MQPAKMTSKAQGLPGKRNFVGSHVSQLSEKKRVIPANLLSENPRVRCTGLRECQRMHKFVA